MHVSQLKEKRTITTLGPRVQKQVEAGEAFMDRYSDVFAALAK